MKYPIYSIRDHKGGFSPQFIVQSNEQSAARGFAFLVSNDKSVMGFSPFDYDLYQIGVFDEVSGIIESITPKFIVNGGSAYEKPES